MRRFLVIAAGVLALVGAYTFFIAPLSEKRKEMKESLQAKYITLHKYETFLKATDRTEAELKAASKEVDGMEANALKETNESIAFAKFQGHIQDFAEKAGLKIFSVKPLSVLKYKYYYSLPIQIEANGGMGQIGEFMKQIDETKRLVKIDRTSINVMNIQTQGDLRIRIQVSGLMKGPDL